MNGKNLNQFLCTSSFCNFAEKSIPHSQASICQAHIMGQRWFPLALHHFSGAAKVWGGQNHQSGQLKKKLLISFVWQHYSAALRSCVGYCRSHITNSEVFQYSGYTKYCYKKLSLATHKARCQLEICSTTPDVIALFLLEHKGSRILQHSDILARKMNSRSFFGTAQNKVKHNFHSLNHIYLFWYPLFSRGN